MLYWNACTKLIEQMLRTAEIDMVNSVVPDDVEVFIDIAAWAIRSTYHAVLDSLTPKSVLAGMKNSLSEGFRLAKHKHTNIPTMMEPFSHLAAWFLWMNTPHPPEPLCKGLDKAVSSKGLV
jgi:hypothetical protein